MNPSVDPVPEGIFGPYEVYERLGMGGMAMVHRAKKRGIEGFERSVALKRMLQHLAEDANFVESFIREAKVASLLHHPNIAQVHDFGRIGGVYYIAMELVSGFDIRKLLRYASRSGEPIPLPAILSILGELADALEYAHAFHDEQGTPLKIVHRDISPSNLIIAHTGHLKVIDFGIAKANSRQLQTESGQIKGKLGYMSPEAAHGMTLDPVSDIFSMGVVAWELCTAMPLFSARTDYETMRRIREADIIPPSYHNPNCPPELDSIIVASLDRDSTTRLPSAGVFRAAIDALATQHNIHHSARSVAEWITRFAQPGDAWMRGSTVPPRAQAPEQPTVAGSRPRAKTASASGRPSFRLQRSPEEVKLAGEIWGDEQGSPARPDFSMPQAPPLRMPISAPPSQPRIAPLMPPVMSPNTGAIPPVLQVSVNTIQPMASQPHMHPPPGHSQPLPLQHAPMHTPTGPVAAKRKMPVIVLGLLFVVAGALGGLLWIKRTNEPPATPTATTGPVKFVVDPASAVIAIAGKEVAHASPFTTELEPGMYTVTVTQDGYKKWSNDITVHAGDPQTINVALEREPAKVADHDPHTPPVDKPSDHKTPGKPGKKLAQVDHKKQPDEVKPPPEVHDVAPPPDAAPEPIKQVEPPIAPSPSPSPSLPAPPARTMGVSASAVTKLSGDIPQLKGSSGASNGDVLVKMCFDETGKVTSVKVVKSSADIATELSRALSTWRYKPFLNKDKQPVPVCFPLSLRVVFKGG